MKDTLNKPVMRSDLVAMLEDAAREVAISNATGSPRESSMASEAAEVSSRSDGNRP